MITSVVQRWRERASSYRPAGEVIRTRDFEVEELTDDTTPKRFIVEHHYSGSYPAARYRFGLYTGGQLVGVAVCSQPINDKALAMLPGERLESLELGRFVLLDRVPANGESWFLARVFELLKRSGIVAAVSFSDPLPRMDSAGARVFRGHIGTIYQATNAVYAGRSTARTLRLLPDGSVFSARTAQKIRALERGWQHAVAQLVEHGAEAFSGDSREWLRQELPKITRTARHPGNHRYLFGITSQAKRLLPRSQPYPKFDGAAA